jgi:hypothetical protein
MVDSDQWEDTLASGTVRESGCVHDEYLSVCRDAEEMVVAGTLGRTTTVPLQAFQRELRTGL